tara:strand:- start:147 stop:1394 length:1248 start_codon:yes stop_codon:yes gene_type:complete
LESVLRKKILIHTIAFNPDGVSTAYLYNDLALGLRQNGYDIVVLTTTPHYNIVESELIKYNLKKFFFGLYFESNYEGIRVIHIPQKKFKSTLLRLISFVYWHIASFIFGLTVKNINFVLSPSPPLSIGLISLMIAKIKGAKSIYNIQEIYPDLIINQGKLKSNFIIKILKILEKLVYNKSDALTTIDQVFYDKIFSRVKNTDKLTIISNFVDTELFNNSHSDLNLPDCFRNSNEKFIIVYAGNIGIFQDWNPLIYASKKLINKNIEFWVIGEGSKKNYLKKVISKNNITNIKVFPYQNRKLMPVINNLADVHFIISNENMENEGFPSKVYTIMACSKPMVIVSGEGTPLHNFLKDKNCSELITSNRNKEFLNSIIRLYKDKELRDILGRNGLRIIQREYSKNVVIKKYINLIKKL